MSGLFGDIQTLTYGSGLGQIQVNLTNDNFVPTDGDGHLKQLGYDRPLGTEQLLKLTRTAMGAPALAKQVYKPFQSMKFNLLINDQQLLALWGMWLRQDAEKLPVILNDQRLAMLETTPRKRAKIGTVSGVTAPPGCVVFWPRMAILLTVQEDWDLLYNCALTEGSVLLKMSATEVFYLEPSTYDLP
jgi:hypothetical protein